MNVFRLVGDFAHLIAIIVLLLKIWKTRSCAGKHLFNTVALVTDLVAQVKWKTSLRKKQRLVDKCARRKAVLRKGARLINCVKPFSRIILVLCAFCEAVLPYFCQSVIHPPSYCVLPQNSHFYLPILPVSREAVFLYPNNS